MKNYVFMKNNFHKDSGYPHDGRADKNPYPHDCRGDKDSYLHDSNNQCILLAILRLQLSFAMINVQLMLAGFALPVAIIAKWEEKIFLAQKTLFWRKQVAKKNLL